MACTLISAAQGFWQRRCMPARTRVSCAFAQSFFRPVSWGFHQMSRRAHGRLFGKLSECFGVPLVLQTGRDGEDSAGMTGSV